MSASRNITQFGKVFLKISKSITKVNYAYYIGGQETANRLEAQGLKNRETLAKVKLQESKLFLQDLEAEERKLRILKLQRELGINAGEFTAENYADPGNIREEERNRKK